MTNSKKRSKVIGDIGRDHPGTIHVANVTTKFKAEGISLSEDIKKHVLMIRGVKKIHIDYETKDVEVIYDPNITNFDSITKAIESQGYICKDETVTTQVEKAIWTGSQAERLLPDHGTTHAEKVIWKGPLAGSVPSDRAAIHVEKVKKISKAKGGKGKDDPETTHVVNVKKKFKAKGMTCKNCELVIKKQVKTMPGVKKIDIDYATEEVQVIYDPHKIKFLNIKEAIESKGYICDEYKGNRRKKNLSTSGWILTVLGIIVVAYYALQYLETIELPQISANMSYGLLFLVGLLTGLHCVSMCGGFVVSYSTKGIKEGKKPHELHLAYGLGKTLSYTIIGAVFGLLGSIIAFTPLMRGVAGILAGLFLMLFGLKMLNIFPVLRKIQFRTPEFISKFTYGQKKSHSDPLTIGLLNGLMIACGPLQAIYIMAAGTGSMIEGAKLLFVFALGTLPVMLSFGYITSFIGGKATHQILKFSGAIVIILGLFMINNGLALTGAGYDINPTIDNAPPSIDKTNPSPVNVNTGSQEIRMDVTRSGYVPSTFTLKKGVPVKWIINGKELTGCNNAIIVPSLGLEFDIKKGEQTIEFTPTEAGTIKWSCWMGMIRGSFSVK
ncbi:MAG: sulfite exporter TauE/SafE family protein [Euryarchaeota archaeon]|nr:sulfite exporter TauE/SafE family protein [Euryarchaeota archaeon]